MQIASNFSNKRCDNCYQLSSFSHYTRLLFKANLSSKGRYSFGVDVGQGALFTYNNC